jgi:formylglycine-generating enzyme required for sulfatase activity
MLGAADRQNMSDAPFDAREAPPGRQKQSDAPSPARRASDESDILRRRLQYALDEVAHLTQALKEARSQAPEDGDEVNALRGQVESLRQATDRMSVELAAATEEREHLKGKLRESAAAREEASATAERTGNKVRVLRHMIAELQRRLDATALELGGKDRERRRLAAELKRRTATLDEMERRLERTVHQPVRRGPSADALSGTAVPAALGIEDRPPVAREPAPDPKTFNRPRPVRRIPPLLWTLPALLVLIVVINRWYLPHHGSDVPTPGAISTLDVAAPPGPALDRADANAMSPATKPAEALPTRQGVRDRLLGGGLGPKMTAVGPATFTMGSDAIRLHPDESPAHDVRVGRFLIGVRETTYAEYERFARSTGTRLPDDFDWGRGQQPVADVSWDDANAYAQWLSRQTGHRYRLPSEAEWEYAARGDSPKSYWWGAELEAGRAVCFDCGTPWDDLMAAPVASLAPNPFGLYDTAGNVMEWVGDCWNPDYTGAHADARARTDGDCRFRVARGGAFNKPAVAMRSAARYHFLPETRIDMLGFRVVRED